MKRKNAGRWKLIFLLAGFMFEFVGTSNAEILINNFAQKIKSVGSYSKFSKIKYSAEKELLKIDYEKESKGDCGIYFPVNLDWTNATQMKIFTKGTPGKILQVTLVDAGNHHFIYDILYPNSEWNMVEIGMEEFRLNPYFQPKEAVDKYDKPRLNLIRQIQLSPTQSGKGTFYVNKFQIVGADAKKSLTQSNQTKQGAFIFLNPRIEYPYLEKFYSASSPIKLGDESQVTVGVWESYSSLNATIYLFTDGTSLYLSAAVQEVSPRYNNKRGGDIWNGDGIELFLGLSREITKTYSSNDFQIGFSPGAPGLEPSAWIFNKNRPLTGANVAAVRTGDGYSLKASIPLKELNRSALEDRQIIFFDVAVDKAGKDGNRVMQLTWHGNGRGHLDPRQWYYAIVGSDRTGAQDQLSEFLKQEKKEKQRAQVTIQGAKILHVINPGVYGINAFPAKDTPAGWMNYSEEAVAVYKQARLSMLRFPGGDWGDEHKLEPSHLKYFMGLCNKLKADPMIQVKLHDSSPQEAAALVKYCKDQNYNIKYWAIGNEPNFYETQHFRGKPYRAKDYIRDFKEFSKAMKKVDPKILLCGPELSAYEFKGEQPSFPLDENQISWMDEFLANCGNAVDIVTFHHYPVGGVNRVADWKADTLLKTTDRWEPLLGGLRAKMKKYLGRELPIGITEINSDWSGLYNGEATADTFTNVIWWTETLGELIKYNVDYVDFFGLYDTGAYGIVTADLMKFPAFFTFEFFKDFGDQFLNVGNDNNDLKVYASFNGKDKYNVIFVNKLTEMDIRANIRFFDLKKKFKKIRVHQYFEHDYLNNQGLSTSELKYSDELEYVFPRYSITQFVLE